MTQPIQPHPVKTIRGTRAAIGTWLAALRSGKYTQAFGQLYSAKGYCCLGVMQKAMTGAVDATNMPKRSWMYTHRDEIQFACVDSSGSDIRWSEFSEVDEKMQMFDDRIIQSPSVLVPAALVGLFGNNWAGDEKWHSAWELNDILNLNFDQIADLLEAHVEYTD